MIKKSKKSKTSKSHTWAPLRLVAGLLRPRLSFSKLSKALSRGKVSVSATGAKFAQNFPENIYKTGANAARTNLLFLPKYTNTFF
jgi:hypothetical protein